MTKGYQEMNILKVGYLPWRPINFKYNIRNFFRTIKWAKQRLTRGYSDWDVWDLYYYLGIVTANSLRHLANTTHSYPAQAGGYGQWKQILNEMADKIEKGSVDYNDHTKWEESRAALQEGLDMLKGYWYDLWD